MAKRSKVKSKKKISTLLTEVEGENQEVKEEIKEEVVGSIENQEVTSTIENQEVTSTIEDENILKEAVTSTIEDKGDIKSFINSMKGKNRANPQEIDIMFKLYQKYTGKKEANKNCSTCVMRVYQTLIKLIK